MERDGNLQADERDVLRLRYGLDDGNSKTFIAVSNIMGIDTKQVSCHPRRAEPTQAGGARPSQHHTGAQPL